MIQFDMVSLTTTFNDISVTSLMDIRVKLTKYWKHLIRTADRVHDNLNPVHPVLDTRVAHRTFACIF